MRPELEIQRKQMTLAVGCLNMIEDCDKKMEHGNHVQYFKTIREKAIQDYADVMADIVSGAIELSAEFKKPLVKSFYQ